MPEQEEKMTGERGAPQGRDPRLLPQDRQPVSALAYYGRAAGWAGSALLLAALFWAGIKHGMTMPIKVVGILGLVCLAFWIYTNLRSLLLAVKARGVQAALGSALFAVFVLGALVLVNYIAGRHHLLRHDFTKSKQFSLADATKNVVKALKEPVTITAFLSEEDPSSQNLRRLLDNYGFASPKVKVTIYDFRTAIDKVQEYNASYPGTMYVEYGKDKDKKKEEIRGGTEEQITSAILAVSTGEKVRIYFLEGHGEAKLQGGVQDQRSLTTIKGILENQQYRCDSLSLFTQAVPQVPADCKLLVIAGPQGPLSAKELDAVRRYLDQGGNLFLMLEPQSAVSFAGLLAPHGVTPLGGTLSDKQNSVEGRPQILAAFPAPHETTNRLEYLVTPIGTPLEVQSPEPPPAMPGAPAPPPAKAVALFRSKDTSTLTGGAQSAPRKGPFTVAAAVDETPPKPEQQPGMPPPPEPEDAPRKSRLVVVGDSDFCTDSMLQLLGAPVTVAGRDALSFAIMAMNWLVKNEKLVAIPPKEATDQPFTVTDSQRRFLTALTILIVPMLIILSGVAMWWLRRRS